MKLISHRGNIDGAVPQQENIPNKIIEVSKNFRVEVDVWMIDGQLYLGHDKKNEAVNINFLKKFNCLVHCKNIEGFEFMSKEKKVESFYQSDELIIITSFGNYLYHSSAALNKNSIENSIHVFLEKNGDIQFLDKTHSLVTDYVTSYINK